MDNGDVGSGADNGGISRREGEQPMPFVQINQPFAPRPTNGLGTAGGVLGIVGAALFWFPGVNFVLALLAFILGLVGLNRGRREGLPIGMAVTGVVLGTLGIISIVGLFVLIGLFSTSV
jgi:hypothetical protein